MKKCVLAAMMVFVFYTACKKAEQPQIEIRINNQTPDNLESVVLYSAEGEKLVGNVFTNTVSGYQQVNGVYEIPACRFNVSGRNVEFLIRCATPAAASLTPGKYTYRVIAAGTQQYEINLLKD
ncbi:MAG: hypothetical protein SFU87_08465 [Chitinophagaceae bacterium]|nr:hypothetical protein [Chitinophagaceae bacterium]